MGNIEKISSLHDDVLVPKATEHLGEYDEYPERFDPEDKSVLTRLEQFSIDLTEAQEAYGKEINQFSWEEYNELIAKAIKARYSTIVGSVFDRYNFSNPENPDEPTKLKEMFELVEQYEDMGSRLGINLIKRKDDFQENGNLVMGLEGAANLIHSVDDIKKIADSGVKIFGLQYGDETPLADVSGLTKLGREGIRHLFDNNLIVDLAHSNYKTRKDVIEMAKDLGKGHLVSYTHGSQEEDLVDAWKDKMGERALKAKEVEEIINNGGIIGLGVTVPFFSSTKKVAERIDTITQEQGSVENIAIGTDFGGVPPAFMHDIKNPEDFKKFANILSSQFGMSDDDIDKVLRANAQEWIKKAID